VNARAKTPLLRLRSGVVSVSPDAAGVPSHCAWSALRAEIPPSAVHLDAKRFAFAGTDKSVGAFRFEGTFDEDFLKTSGTGINSAHPTDQNILHGTLTVGGKAYKIDLGWFEGD